MSPQLIDLSQRLILVLAHTLWQGVLVALLTAIVLRLLPARRHHLRYVVPCVALVAVVISALATWSILQLPRTPDTGDLMTDQSVSREQADFVASSGGLHRDDRHQSALRSSGISSVLPARARFRAMMPWLAGFWLTGVGLMLIRASRGFVQVRSWLQQTDQAEPLQLPQLRTELRELRMVLGLRRSVGLLTSPFVKSPVLIGNWWPVIVLPASMLSGTVLSVEQWRIVLAHELAHVRRFDGLVNLAQMLVESVLFFNPAVWWISRRIRVERESCCDALAARVAGSRRAVAVTLLNVAETVTAPVEAALAFSEPAGSGSLRDRVVRLASPDSIPHTRLTWLGLACSLLIIASTAFALQQGTDVAVRSAAALLTHQERVDELARLQADHSGVAVPEAEGGQTPDQKVPVRVVVRREDGGAVPQGTRLSSVHVSGNSSTASGLDTARESQEVFEHTKSFSAGTLRVGAFAAEYAPAISDVIRLRPSDGPQTIELILGRGFDASIAVTTPDGEPVDDVEVEVQGALSHDGVFSGPSTERRQLRVADGALRLPSVSLHTSYRMTVLSPGWEFDQRDFTFTEATAQEWSLRRAQAMRLRFIADETGMPVAGARVLLLGWKDINQRGSGMRNGDPRERDLSDHWVLGVSDEHGQVTIDRLSRKLRHTLAIRADGYQLETLWSVRPNGSPPTIRLSPPISVSGQLVGDLGRLRRRRGQGRQERVFSYRNDIREPGESSYSGIHYAAVADDGSFEVTDLVPGRLTLELPDGEQKLRVTESLSGLSFEIPEPEERQPTALRQVVVRLVGLPEDLTVRGELQLHWSGQGRTGNQTLPVRDNQLSLDVPQSCALNIRVSSLVGCVAESIPQVSVTPGTEPLVVELPVIQAGAVHGTVLRADGQEPAQLFIHVFAVRETLPSASLQMNPSASTPANSWFRSLPYGGTYCVLVREISSEQYSWAVSDEFTVTADNPIQQIDLKLCPTRPFQVQVTDDRQQPVADAWVKLSVGHSFDGHSAGHPVNRTTDGQGLADFGEVTLDGDSGPAEVRVWLDVPPVSGFRGQLLEVDEFDETLTLELERGVAAHGILIDDATGRPIPGAAVRIHPRHFSQTNYRGQIQTRTDNQGRFEFSGLEPVEYTGYVNGATDPGAIVTPGPDGGHRIDHAAARQPLRLFGGDAEPVEWLVQILPGRGLEPLRAPREAETP